MKQRKSGGFGRKAGFGGVKRGNGGAARKGGASSRTGSSKFGASSRGGFGGRSTRSKGPRNFGMKFGDDKFAKTGKFGTAKVGIVGKSIGGKVRTSRFASGVKGSLRSPFPVRTESDTRKWKALKLLKSLHNKKDRENSRLFIVEGEKSFLETIESDYQLHTVIATHGFLNDHPEISASLRERVFIVDENELVTLGTLAMNKTVIGIFHMPGPIQFKMNEGITLVLSGVNDPGNLGTLIRIADWYGIKTIIASRDTVDMYNPKVISATKGSFTRVHVWYRDLAGFFAEHQNIPVFAADLDGGNVHTAPFPQSGILLLGSEAHGIDPELDEFITTRITIPRFGDAESLNVAVAGAIILDVWRNR